MKESLDREVWAAMMPDVARRLLGEPARTTGGTVRYGKQGSLAVHIGGAYPGTWRDHEAGTGGGTLALVEHVLECDRKAALRWLTDHGYLSANDAEQVSQRSDPQRQADHQAADRAREVARIRGYERAAVEAQAMIARATFAPHPYLERKGFPNEQGLTLDDKLLITMRDIESGEVCAVQAIDPDGAKKFQPGGCRASDTVHIMGPGFADVWFWCEGYVTALAIRAGLASMSRTDDRIVACFSSGQLGAMAGHYGRGISLVVADNDMFRCRNRDCKAAWDEPRDACPECGGGVQPPAGETAAKKTGLPWWSPDSHGDANDFYLREGVRALGRELIYLIRDVTLRGRR